jgi:hypothetical protein
MRPSTRKNDRQICPTRHVWRGAYTWGTPQIDLWRLNHA